MAGARPFSSNMGAGILKCALMMARNSSGVVMVGTKSLAAQGGTASTIASLGVSGTAASPKSIARMLRLPRVMPRNRVLNCTVAPLVLR